MLATLAVTAGVATLVAASPVTMMVLTFAGSGYMIWLGVQTLRHPPSGDLETRVLTASSSRLFMKGFVLNLLNPKLYLFFLALLPQFISTAAQWPIAVRIVTTLSGVVMIGLGLALIAEEAWPLISG